MKSLLAPVFQAGLVFLMLAGLFLPGGMPGRAQDDGTPTYRIVGYYSSWSIYARRFMANDLPGDKLTHINYAFANVSADGGCMIGDASADVQFFYSGDTADDAFRGNFNQLIKLKKEYPHLKTLISVGGWSWSDRFSDVALTADSRAHFAESCIQFMKQYGFDGIDIDWEYPGGGGKNPNVGRPEDTENFTLLLAELRTQLDVQGEADGGAHYLLTIAAPASPTYYEKIQLDQIPQYLDFINVMTYDFYGSMSATTGHHAPLYASASSPADTVRFNVDSVVQDFLAAGVPADKLVVGVPFYGKGWAGVPNENNGLFQPSTGLPRGTYENGWFDYGDLAKNYVGTYPRYWDDQAKAPYLYDPDKGVFITYEDPESLAIKTNYVKEHSLGGIMFWELSEDDPTLTLLNTIYEALSTGE